MIRFAWKFSFPDSFDEWLYNQLMGGCMGANGPRSDERDKFDSEPVDTQGMRAEDFPVLSFKALLTKLKMKWCSYYKFVSIRISFGHWQQFELKSKFISNQTAKWEIYHQFDFKATELELRKEFMMLSFFSDQGKMVGKLKINLYLLATGPYHQDFAVELEKAEGARISFNLKIAQEVMIKLKVNEVQMMPKEKEFPGDLFAFGINAIMGDRLEESELSYKYLVAFKEGELQESPTAGIGGGRRIEKKLTMGEMPRLQNHLQMKKSKDDNQKQMQQPLSGFKKVQWSIKKSQQLPIVETFVPLFDLHGASFNVIFYTFRNKIKQFHSECFLSYNKLMSEECIISKEQMSKKTLEERKVNIESKIWNNGREAGKAKFSLIFIIQRHIKQMQLCVRTERGILESSPVFGESSGSKIPVELQQLEKLGNQIQNQFIQASQSNIKIHGVRWVSQVNKRLIRMQQILEISSKQSKLTFIYPDEGALMKGQRGLIEIGKRIRSLLDEDKDDIAEHCWKLLIILIKRGQLTLPFIGFSQKQREEFISDNRSQFLQRKKEVSLSYHVLLVDLLQRTLKSLEASNYQSQREFAEIFCAYAYFRLPKFRNQILTAITRIDDPEIEQWRGIEFNLSQRANSQTSAEKTNTSFQLLFDWQSNFYYFIQSEEYFKKTEAKLGELLRTNDWQVRIRKRGGAFFAFITYWVHYIQSIVVNSKHISWRYFPGYNKILLSFFAEMKIRPLENYSEGMKLAAGSLLSNQKILNPFVLIILRKTNEHDQLNVVKAFDLISNLIGSIRDRGRSLPSIFDYKLLFKAMTTILSGQGAFAMGKVLVVLYQNYMAFSIDFRIDITNYLFTKVFFKLFLHWSFNVRTIFQHLLFIRIYHENSKPLNQLDFKEQQVFRYSPESRNTIVSRYMRLMLILENAQQFEHKIRDRKINSFQKDTFKKLKKKVQEKMKERGTNPRLPSKKAISNEDPKEYSKQMMRELSQPKMQRYNSEVMSRTLKIVVENRSQAPNREEVIVHNTTSKKNLQLGKRRFNVADINFQEELVALKDEEISYIRPSLDEYSKLSQNFIKNLERNKDSIPVVKLEMSLDEKQMRPQGFGEAEQW